MDHRIEHTDTASAGQYHLYGYNIESQFGESGSLTDPSCLKLCRGPGGRPYLEHSIDNSEFAIARLMGLLDARAIIVIGGVRHGSENGGPKLGGFARFHVRRH